MLRKMLIALLATLLAATQPVAAGASNPPVSTWHRVAAGPFGGLVGAAATAGPDGKIYVISGQQLERLDPASGRWAVLPVQPTSYHTGLVAVGDQLYAVGGMQDPHVEVSFT